MSDKRIPKFNLDLNLSLELSQEEDPDKDQGQFVAPQEQSKNQFMQPLRSNPQPSFTPPGPMTSPLQFFRDYHHDFSNLPTLPRNFSSPHYRPLEQDQLLPSQAVTVETGESSHRGHKRSSVDADDQGQFVHPQEQSHGQFMQPLRSDPQPSFTSPDLMTSPIQFFPSYLDFLNLPALPLNFPSPYFQPLEQDQMLPSQAVTVVTGESSHSGRRRSIVDADEIQPPYPWATNRPAVIKTIRDLSLENINVISGQVICKSCKKAQTLEYNLEDKFNELCQYIMNNKEQMRNRAPDIWMNPKLTQCEACKSEMRPVDCDKKEINWLFLLLGQMLGCCSLNELKFFCKTNSHHCTGSKRHLVYSAYLGLCKQLDPNGPFN